MKLISDLRQQLKGEVIDTPEALDYFSTDGSVFQLRPQAVIYPKSAGEVEATMSYLHRQAAQGKKITVTARGKGTDQGGGALGDGVMLVFPAHMDRLIKLDKKSVTVQPGLLYKDLQNTLHSHDRFLPPYPASIDFCTIGGAVANNACGEKTLKYGSTRQFVERLEVVLADGTVIETKRLSARQLRQKKGQLNLEGEIYRQLDGLLSDHTDLLGNTRLAVSKNSAGYDLWDIKRRDGSFDLTPLIVGAQGTLGIITEITLKTAPFQPHTSLLVGYFDDLEAAGAAVLQLQKLQPSAMEVVDYHLLDFVRQHKPATLVGLVPEQLPKVVVLIEFDNPSQLQQNRLTRKAEKILVRFASSFRQSREQKEQDRLWQIRHSAAAVLWQTQGNAKALPLIEDGVVPVEKLPQFLDETYKLLEKHKLTIAVWGHAGNANFHMQPFMDLSQAKDRKKVFELMDEFYAMVIRLGGSTCGEHNDGILRAPYLKKLYGKEMYELFKAVKQVFDPLGILNPNIKFDVTQERQKELLRSEYSMRHLYDHLPKRY